MLEQPRIAVISPMNAQFENRSRELGGKAAWGEAKVFAAMGYTIAVSSPDGHTIGVFKKGEKPGTLRRVTG